MKVWSLSDKDTKMEILIRNSALKQDDVLQSTNTPDVRCTTEFRKIPVFKKS